ncbi:hypothetical protein DFH08DRAFT_1053264 [Mycena albidolilacea]|uniref:Uncharacterized protein n=1 Tax=Mycena albidolilacea TaxID=1033008 RepID=A0AAD7AEH7_9AGAR|nr:hypothetical protein DFH08DRAFT_1053264 [Mycena albidolilacea]
MQYKYDGFSKQTHPNSSVPVSHHLLSRASSTSSSIFLASRVLLGAYEVAYLSVSLGTHLLVAVRSTVADFLAVEFAPSASGCLSLLDLQLVDPWLIRLAYFSSCFRLLKSSVDTAQGLDSPSARPRWDTTQEVDAAHQSLAHQDLSKRLLKTRQVLMQQDLKSHMTRVKLSRIKISVRDCSRHRRASRPQWDTAQERAKSSRRKSLKSHIDAPQGLSHQDLSGRLLKTSTRAKSSRLKTSVGHCSRARQILAPQEPQEPHRRASRSRASRPQWDTAHDRATSSRRKSLRSRTRQGLALGHCWRCADRLDFCFFPLSRLAANPY